MDFQDRKALLGLKIKNFRKQKGYTQEKLSEVLSMDVSALSKIENGKCFPSIESVCKIMETLKISPNSVFDFVLSFDDESLKSDIVID